jgi:hypothetical protein
VLILSYYMDYVKHGSYPMMQPEACCLTCGGDHPGLTALRREGLPLTFLWRCCDVCVA